MQAFTNKQIKDCYLVFVFLVSLIARIVKLIVDPILLRDSIYYLQCAEIWHATGNYIETTKDGIIPPLPIFFVKELMRYDFSSEIAGRSFSLFFSALIPVVGTNITYRIFKKKNIAFIASLLLIFHPTLVSYSIQPLRENYYLLFLGLAIDTAIKGIKLCREKDFLYCGIFVALASYSRYESLEFLLIIPATLLWITYKKFFSTWKCIRSFIYFFCGFTFLLFTLLHICNCDFSFIVKTIQYKDRLINSYERSFYNDTKMYQ